MTNVSKKAYLELISEGPEDTFVIGNILGQYLTAGDVVALTGELGAGKTCLTQGIARGLGVSERYQITSPTFTIVNEYPGRLVLNHVDVYRLKGSMDLEAIGYEDILYGGGVTVIEWADIIRDALPEDSILITMAYLEEQRRKIEIFLSVELNDYFLEAYHIGG